MTPDNPLVIALIVFALALALAFGVYQWRKARAARGQQQHSAVGDLREGMPGAPWAASARAGVSDQRDASA